MPPNRDARRDVSFLGQSKTNLVFTDEAQILAQDIKRRVDSAERLSESPENPINYAYLATETEGYLATDLIDLCSRAVHEALIRSSNEELSEVRLLEYLPVLKLI